MRQGWQLVAVGGAPVRTDEELLAAVDGARGEGAATGAGGGGGGGASTAAGAAEAVAAVDFDFLTAGAAAYAFPASPMYAECARVFGGDQCVSLAVAHVLRARE